MYEYTNTQKDVSEFGIYFVVDKGAISVAVDAHQFCKPLCHFILFQRHT
jgi:hypothetical protein